MSLITTFSAAAQAQVVTLNKGGYTLSYDCTNRTALRYEYVLQADTGSAARPSSFNLDTELPSGCAGQTSSASYASVRSGYDRGHLVTSNHMDYNTTYIRRANLMSNIVPQVASFNQGIWVRAEEVAECYRKRPSLWGRHLQRHDQRLLSHQSWHPHAGFFLEDHHHGQSKWRLSGHQLAHSKQRHARIAGQLHRQHQ
ncbi:endonuclease G [Xanthomonas arboricola]|nr:endonuclease G [Xanthomonas sp. 3793]